MSKDATFKTMLESNYPITMVIILCLLFSSLCAIAQEGLTAQRLFHIERNKNASIVVYDAWIEADSSLNQQRPLDVYWLMIGKDSSRQRFHKIERSRTYGFDTEGVGKDSLVIKLKAKPERIIEIHRIKDSYRAMITVGDR